MTVAVLFVQRGGVYWDLPDVDPWDKERDARLYAGPHPVVAHPPCKRWGRYWFGSPSGDERFDLGDDDGCFEAAVGAVRRCNGVLEHPAGSRAWLNFGIAPPPHSGGWVNADFFGGWTCQVEQGHYGHPARKPTWLYARGVDLPSLRWGPSVAPSTVEAMSKRQRAATPTPFRDLLLSMARSACSKEAA